jgi:hypothetical protein
MMTLVKVKSSRQCDFQLDFPKGVERLALPHLPKSEVIAVKLSR